MDDAPWLRFPIRSATTYARLEREVEENEKKRRKVQDLLLTERRQELERLRAKYAVQAGTKIGSNFVLHASQRTGDTFSGEVLFLSVAGDNAGWATGDRAIVTGEMVTIEEAKLYVSDNKTISHVLPGDADSKIIFRPDGRMKFEKGGTLTMRLSSDSN